MLLTLARRAHELKQRLDAVDVNIFRDDWSKGGHKFTLERLYGLALEQSLLVLAGRGGSVDAAVLPSCLVGGLQTVGEKNVKLTVGGQGFLKEILKSLWTEFQRHGFNVLDIDAAYPTYTDASGVQNLFHDVVGAFVRTDDSRVPFTGLCSWELYCTQSQDLESARVQDKLKAAKKNFALAGSLFQHLFVAVIFFRFQSRLPTMRTVRFLHIAKRNLQSDFHEVFLSEPQPLPAPPPSSSNKRRRKATRAWSDIKDELEYAEIDRKVAVKVKSYLAAIESECSSQKAVATWRAHFDWDDNVSARLGGAMQDDVRSGGQPALYLLLRCVKQVHAAKTSGAL